MGLKLAEEALHKYPEGYENQDWMLHDPDLDSLRNLPRYSKLIDYIDRRIAERELAKA